MKKHLLVASILLACTAPQAFSMIANKITYDNGMVFTVALGCFDEESCAYLRKAVANNPKLKPYTDIIGTTTEDVGEDFDSSYRESRMGKGWPVGSFGITADTSTEKCSVSWNIAKDKKTVIGVEVMDMANGGCNL